VCFYIENAIGKQLLLLFGVFARIVDVFPCFCLCIENAIGKQFLLLFEKCLWKATFATICGICVHPHRFATAWKATFVATCHNLNPVRHKNLVFYEYVFYETTRHFCVTFCQKRRFRVRGLQCQIANAIGNQLLLLFVVFACIVDVFLCVFT
jgi:hypothetical protein